MISATSIDNGDNAVKGCGIEDIYLDRREGHCQISVMLINLGSLSMNHTFNSNTAKASRSSGIASRAIKTSSYEKHQPHENRPIGASR
jgi:hypothetical protein